MTRSAAVDPLHSRSGNWVETSRRIVIDKPTPRDRRTAICQDGWIASIVHAILGSTISISNVTGNGLGYSAPSHVVVDGHPIGAAVRRRWRPDEAIVVKVVVE